jgi:hypothetical protein
MPKSLAQKLIESHLMSGRPEVGEELGLRVDRTLTQDATGSARCCWPAAWCAGAASICDRPADGRLMWEASPTPMAVTFVPTFGVGTSHFVA